MREDSLSSPEKDCDERGEAAEEETKKDVEYLLQENEKLLTMLEN